MDNVRLIAFDLDGTLTQHKTKLAQPNLGVLDALRAKYKLLMVGAGMCSRIFSQMNGYPIDITGCSSARITPRQVSLTMFLMNTPPVTAPASRPV